MRFDGYLIFGGVLFFILLFFTCSLLHSSESLGARKVARLGILLGLSLVLGLVEGFLPDFLLPGMRLGLANVSILLILYVYGFKDGLFVALLKAILVAVLRGNFLSMGGFMAFSGTLLSFLGMSALHYAFKQVSIFAVSIFGALLHVVGQILVSYVYLGVAVWGYLPWLLLVSFFTGALVAFLCHLLLRHKSLVAYLKSSR